MNLYTRNENLVECRLSKDLAEENDNDFGENLMTNAIF